MSKDMTYSLVWSVDFVNNVFEAKLNKEISGLKYLDVSNITSKDIRFLMLTIEYKSYKRASEVDHYNRLVDKMDILYEFTDKALDHIQNRKRLTSLIYSIGYFLGFYKKIC